MKHTTTKTVKPIKTGSKIEQIDPTLYKAGIKNGLNIKDIRFCGDIIKGKTQTEAYKNNIAKEDTSEITARVNSSQKLTNAKVQNTLKDVMIKAGMTDNFLLEKHKKLLNKTEKRLKNNITTGKIDVIDTGEIDTTAVKAGLEMAYKLKGYYNNTEETDKGNTYIQNNIIDTNAIDKLLKLDNG